MISRNCSEFFEIDLLLVEELRLYFHGATTTTPEDPNQQSLRVYIESSGPFLNRLDGRTDYFITKAMSNRVYQYNLVTGAQNYYKTSNS